jgi:hypothetical protein
MDISVEYPFIMFVIVFESSLIFFLSAFSQQIYVAGIGDFPSTMNFNKPITLFGFTISLGSFLDKCINICYYVFDVIAFLFKLLILPNVPIEFRFLSTLVFIPLSVVLGYLIFKTIIPIIQSIIGIIP